jgi:hypothetical protein
VEKKMQTYGDIGKFKESLNSVYEQKLHDYEQVLQANLAQKKVTVDEQKRKILEQFEQMFEKQKELLHKKVYGEELLAVRLEIESQKRELFDTILEQAKSQEEIIYSSKKYQDYVLSYNPTEIIVSKKAFTPKGYTGKVTVQDGAGLLAKANGAIIDLSVSSLLSQKKVDLYILLDSILFGTSKPIQIPNSITKKPTESNMAANAESIKAVLPAAKPKINVNTNHQKKSSKQIIEKVMSVKSESKIALKPELKSKEKTSNAPSQVSKKDNFLKDKKAKSKDIPPKGKLLDVI